MEEAVVSKPWWKSKSVWLGVLTIGIQVGTAAGYIPPGVGEAVTGALGVGAAANRRFGDQSPIHFVTPRVELPAAASDDGGAIG